MSGRHCIDWSFVSEHDVTYCGIYDDYSAKLL